MERELQWLCLALLPLFIIQVTSKLDNSVTTEITSDNNLDFISIDCGASAAYRDLETGIWYETDKGFIETGTNHRVSPSTNLNYRYFGQQLNNLRSFPEGDRNCYSVKPKQGANHSYFIRALFAYGNYDFKNQTESFDLYIGVDYWDTIGSDSDYTYSEIIYTPTTDIIYVCLVKTGSEIPYISSLELRPLRSPIYHTQIMSNTTIPPPLLFRQLRIDIGAPLLQLSRVNAQEDLLY